MSNIESRENYIESEFKKWEEKFEIPFEKEFSVKALLSMQYQFINLPDDHVKSKADVMKTITDINRSLDLKRKIKLNDKEKKKVLFITDRSEKSRLNVLFKSLINPDDIESYKSDAQSTCIKTGEFSITILSADEDSVRGLRADEAFVVSDGIRKIYGIEDKQK